MLAVDFLPGLRLWAALRTRTRGDSGSEPIALSTLAATRERHPGPPSPPLKGGASRGGGGRLLLPSFRPSLAASPLPARAAPSVPHVPRSASLPAAARMLLARSLRRAAAALRPLHARPLQVPQLRAPRLVGPIAAARPFTRSLWLLCREANGPGGLLSSAPASISCGCGRLHTEGEHARLAVGAHVGRWWCALGGASSRVGDGDYCDQRQARGGRPRHASRGVGLSGFRTPLGESQAVISHVPTREQESQACLFRKKSHYSQRPCG